MQEESRLTLFAFLVILHLTLNTSTDASLTGLFLLFNYSTLWANSIAGRTKDVLVRIIRSLKAICALSGLIPAIFTWTLARKTNTVDRSFSIWAKSFALEQIK